MLQDAPVVYYFSLYTVFQMLQVNRFKLIRFKLHIYFAN